MTIGEVWQGQERAHAGKWNGFDPKTARLTLLAAVAAAALVTTLLTTV
jgi:hypothetical protein